MNHKYKVVYEDYINPRFNSKKGLFSAAVRGGDRIQYELMEWTKSENWRPDYKLTYFDNLESAKGFLSIIALSYGLDWEDYKDDYKIYSCKIRGKAKQLPPMYGLHSDGIDFQMELSDKKWPDRTCMAEKIMLVEEIKI